MSGEITFSDGRKVKYIYTADGAKVRTTYYDATGSQTLQVDYCGNYILHNGVVDRILTSLGYIKNDTVYSYVKRENDIKNSDSKINDLYSNSFPSDNTFVEVKQIKLIRQ